ncbi:protein phosphatase 1 regulatory subunit 3C [Hoplias malabaricus]|uniref:protein phosphatase 1 regulatory subunit 3C n=1 Tax=Hoplias malabaricus TaxID=27720 RepID=UPI0034621196
MAAAKVLPVDMFMHMGLSRRAAVRQRSDMSSMRYQLTLPRPSAPSEIPCSLRAATPSQLTPSPPVSPLSYYSSAGTLKKKKRVVFADTKGLALTDVRIFTVDPPESPADAPAPSDKLKDPPHVQGRILRLKLGFPQPSANLPSFLGSLADSLVRLESCRLTGGSLSGMVRVYNISLEKTVHIRITYDSWRTHKDIPCTYIKQPAGSETENFIFSVPFPSDLNLQDRVEFRVLFRPGCGSTCLWDDNGGQNYRIFVDVVDPAKIPLVWKRLFLSRSSKWPQTWPKRKSQALHSTTYINPSNPPENMISTPLSRQENIVPLC